jgi:hypothetical protein
MAQPTAIDSMCAFFAVVHAPRRQHPTTLHALATSLTITILATICGAQNWVEIAPWGHAKVEWLAEFLDLASGMPSHDPFWRVFAVLDPARLPRAHRRLPAPRSWTTWPWVLAAMIRSTPR